MYLIILTLTLLPPNLINAYIMCSIILTLVLLLPYNLTNAYSSLPFYNNWFPVVPISTTDLTNPKSIEMYGKNFVLWKKNNEYVFQDDSCPHRGTSLSEGYFDKDSENLRCSYHGWEFNEKGFVTCIPQNNDTNVFSNINLLKTYPTTIHANILWVYLGDGKEIIKHPEKIYNLTQYDATYVREVPYDVNILLENLFDPAHIPFAHHKMQSTRDKGVPIKIIENYKNNNTLSISFTSKYSNGTTTFTLPHHYVLFDVGDNNFINKLHVFCVPVRNGTTRLFLHYDFDPNNFVIKKFEKLPIWFRHTLTNKFFDSDTMLLFKQQENLINKNSLTDPIKTYIMPTESDDAIKIYNKWIKTNFKIPYLVNKQPYQYNTRKDVMNIYEQHTKLCKSCSDTYKNIKLAKRGITIICIFIGVVTNFHFFFLLSALNFMFFEKFEKMFEYNDYIHNSID